MPSYYFHTVQSGIFLDDEGQVAKGVASSACERRDLPDIEAAKQTATRLAEQVTAGKIRIGRGAASESELHRRTDLASKL